MLVHHTTLVLTKVFDLFCNVHRSVSMSGESSAVSLTPLAVLMATATLDTPDMAPVLAVPLATAATQTSLFRDTVTQRTASRVWATLTVIR